MATIFKDLNQSQCSGDNVTGGLSEPEKQHIGLYPLQSLDSSYVLPPIQLDSEDDNELFHLSFLDLEK